MNLGLRLNMEGRGGGMDWPQGGLREMESLIPKDEPSTLKTIGSRAKTNYGARAWKSINFKTRFSCFNVKSKKILYEYFPKIVHLLPKYCPKVVQLGLYKGFRLCRLLIFDMKVYLRVRNLVILGYSTPDITVDLHITLDLCIILYIHPILYLHTGSLVELQLRINWYWGVGGGLQKGKIRLSLASAGASGC